VNRVWQGMDIKDLQKRNYAMRSHGQRKDNTENVNVIWDSIKKLENWLVENDWKAYDAFDGLSSKLLSRLTLDNHYLRIIAQQTVRRFPVNLRPLLGIRKESSSKGMAFCALGYLKLYQATNQIEYLNKIDHCLDWLMRNPSHGYSGYCWGNHFSYESRGGRISQDTPTIVWTALIGNVFLDAYETLDRIEYLEVAKSSGDFILNDIERYRDSEDSFCFMYTPMIKGVASYEGCIHNSNLLGAWLLGRLFHHSGDQKLKMIARQAVNFGIKYQLPHGGWYYGEPRKFRWEDSFHTGYNLESLYGYIRATGDMEYENSLIRGFKYFKATFFKENGTPRYYNYKTYPIDIQCASQGIQTLVNLREYDDTALQLAKQVALWTIENMQDSTGHFYFRKYPLIVNKTPTFHWGQATMLSALASLVKASSLNETYEYDQTEQFAGSRNY